MQIGGAKEYTFVKKRLLRSAKHVLALQRSDSDTFFLNNLFVKINGRYLIRVQYYRDTRVAAFNAWGRVVT